MKRIHKVPQKAEDGERICYKGILATRTKGNFHRQDNAHSESEDFGFEVNPEDGKDAFTHADYHSTKEWEG